MAPRVAALVARDHAPVDAPSDLPWGQEVTLAESYRAGDCWVKVVLASGAMRTLRYDCFVREEKTGTRIDLRELQELDPHLRETARTAPVEEPPPAVAGYREEIGRCGVCRGPLPCPNEWRGDGVAPRGMHKPYDPTLLRTRVSVQKKGPAFQGTRAVLDELRGKLQHRMEELRKVAQESLGAPQSTDALVDAIVLRIRADEIENTLRLILALYGKE